MAGTKVKGYKILCETEIDGIIYCAVKNGNDHKIIAKSELAELESSDIYTLILDHLSNERMKYMSGRRLKLTPDIQASIAYWLSQGFTSEDFKAVHEHFCEKWGNDPANRAYLNPATLYKKGKSGWGFDTKVDIATSANTMSQLPAFS